MSMWISNTAATAMMLPIGLGVLGTMQRKGAKAPLSNGVDADAVVCGDSRRNGDYGRYSTKLDRRRDNRRTSRHDPFIRDMDGLWNCRYRHADAGNGMALTWLAEFHGTIDEALRSGKRITCEERLSNGHEDRLTRAWLSPWRSCSGSFPVCLEAMLGSEHNLIV